MCIPPVLGEKGDTKGWCVWGTRVGVRSVPKAPLGNFVKNCQSSVREREREREREGMFSNPQFGAPFYIKLLTMVVLGSRVCLPCTKIWLSRAHFSHIKNSCDSRLTGHIFSYEWLGLRSFRGADCGALCLLFGVHSIWEDVINQQYVRLVRRIRSSEAKRCWH
jgi:hypothetical protein